LNVAEWDASVEGGDEGVAEGMRTYFLVHSGPFCDSTHYSRRAVAVQAAPVRTSEDRSAESLTDGEVDRPRGARCQGDGDDLAALAQNRQGAVSPLETQGSMFAPVASETRRPFEREQRDQSVFDGWPQAGRYQQGADFVGVQANGVGVVVQPRPPNVDRWGDGDEAFFFGVAVEPGDGAQPPRDGRPGEPTYLESGRSTRCQPCGPRTTAIRGSRSTCRTPAGATNKPRGWRLGSRPGNRPRRHVGPG
jgi:hypothetical protein